MFRQTVKSRLVTGHASRNAATAFLGIVYATMCGLAFAGQIPTTQGSISLFAIASSSDGNPATASTNPTSGPNNGPTVLQGARVQAQVNAGPFPISLADANMSAGAGALFGEVGAEIGGAFSASWHPPLPGFGYALAQYNGAANADYTDYVTLFSEDLPNGTAVSAVLTDTLEGNTRVSTETDINPGNVNAMLRSNVSAFVALGGTGASVSFCADDVVGLTPTPGCHNVGNANINANINLTESTLAVLHIGQTYELTGGVEVVAFGSGGVVGDITNGQTGLAQARFLDTSQTFLQPLGDFSFSAASGHDYSPPAGAPEPGSLVLLAIGLCGLTLVRSRKSRLDCRQMTASKRDSRRGFVARLLGLASTPFAAKVAVALPADATHALGEMETTTLGVAEATALARAWIRGLFRIEHYVPHGIVYGYHPLSNYYFFFVDRGELYIGASETIAVRKSDGEVSHCGWIGE